MNLTNLDLDTLRTLVIANDLGGYGEAARRLGRTPSAISLQMKRLQDDIGATLFRKEGRRIALTEAGHTRCFNIADGFEGPLDDKRHRGAIGGWKAQGLPWSQS